MARKTAQLFRELLESLNRDIEIIEKNAGVTEGEDAPRQEELSAVLRVVNLLQSAADKIRLELPELEKMK